LGGQKDKTRTPSNNLRCFGFILGVTEQEILQKMAKKSLSFLVELCVLWQRCIGILPFSGWAKCIQESNLEISGELASSLTNFFSVRREICPIHQSGFCNIARRKPTQNPALHT